MFILKYDSSPAVTPTVCQLVPLTIPQNNSELGGADDESDRDTAEDPLNPINKNPKSAILQGAVNKNPKSGEERERSSWDSPKSVLEERVRSAWDSPPSASWDGWLGGEDVPQAVEVQQAAWKEEPVSEASDAVVATVSEASGPAEAGSDSETVSADAASTDTAEADWGTIEQGVPSEVAEAAGEGASWHGVLGTPEEDPTSEGDGAPSWGTETDEAAWAGTEAGTAAYNTDEGVGEEVQWTGGGTEDAAVSYASDGSGETPVQHDCAESCDETPVRYECDESGSSFLADGRTRRCDPGVSTVPITYACNADGSAPAPTGGRSWATETRDVELACPGSELTEEEWQKGAGGITYGCDRVNGGDVGWSAANAANSRANSADGGGGEVLADIRTVVANCPL